MLLMVPFRFQIFEKPRIGKILMPERLFGHVPGYPEGSLFKSRAEPNESKAHIPTQAGISGSQKEGVESIVLSGGYEDDADYGDVLIYTRHAGRDPQTGQPGDLPQGFGAFAGVPNSTKSHETTRWTQPMKARLERGL